MIHCVERRGVRRLVCERREGPGTMRGGGVGSSVVCSGGACTSTSVGCCRALRAGRAGTNASCRGAAEGAAATSPIDSVTWTASMLRTPRSCSSVSSILVGHRQQSATINHCRTDIGALQSGHAHINTPLSSQNVCPPMLTDWGLARLTPVDFGKPRDGNSEPGGGISGNAGRGPRECREITGRILAGLREGVPGNWSEGLSAAVIRPCYCRESLSSRLFSFAGGGSWPGFIVMVNARSPQYQSQHIRLCN